MEVEKRFFITTKWVVLLPPVLPFFIFMPVRKQFECVETLNTLKAEISEDDHHLLLTIKPEIYNDDEIEIFLTRNDLLELIDELNAINEELYENEKGGSNE